MQYQKSVRPKAFKRFLLDNDLLFASIPAEYQDPTIDLLYRGFAECLRHNTKLDGVFPVFWQQTKLKYGSAEAFHATNATLGYFELRVGAQVGYCSRGYALTPRAQHLCETYLAASNLSIADAGDSTETGLETQDGKPYSTPAKPIRSRTDSGANTRFKGDYPMFKTVVEVNGDALHAFHNAAEAWLSDERPPKGFEWLHEALDATKNAPGINGGIVKATNRAKRGIVQASLLLDMAKRSGVIGYVVPMTYLEHSTGRLYAEGALTLQGCIKEVRRAALMGCWDVDVDNAHWRVLSQLAARLSIPTPNVDAYLANKDETRALIAEQTELPLGDVKQMLVALIYGAHLSGSPAGDNALETLLGKAALKRVRENEIVKGLVADIKAAKVAIIEDYRGRVKQKGPNVIVNDAGRSIICTETTKDQQLAHILQGAESEILRACMERVSSIVLLSHDGFACREKVNVSMLQEYVKTATGYEVTFTQKKL